MHSLPTVCCWLRCSKGMNLVEQKNWWQREWKNGTQGVGVGRTGSSLQSKSKPAPLTWFPSDSMSPLFLAGEPSVVPEALRCHCQDVAYTRSRWTSCALNAHTLHFHLDLKTKTSDGTSRAATHVVRPLGSVMVIYGLVVLVMGTIRYFRIQNTLTHGIFPMSLHGVAGLSFIMGALITTVFSLLVAGAT